MTLHIIGTSHIAKESVEQVRKYFDDEQVDILAIELDEGRLHALIEDTKHDTKQERRTKGKRRGGISLREVRTIGVKGYLFAKLAHWAEHSLGDKVGSAPGTEMLSAYHIARAKNIPVALVDQDVRITLKNISRRFTWGERWNFVKDIFLAILTALHIVKPNKTAQLVLQDLTKVPREHLIQELLKETKKRYPTLYYTLVTERNKIIARRIASLQHEHPSAHILAVLGAGHEKEVITWYQKYMKADYFQQTSVSTDATFKKPKL